MQLSQTMLGDNPEKSKNPLKKAMRRRNAKTVQFTAPTYFEASEVEYSSEEEEEPEGDYFSQGQEEEVADRPGEDQELMTDKSATVEPLKSSGQTPIDPQAAIDPRVDGPSQNDAADGTQSYEEPNEQAGTCMEQVTIVIDTYNDR